MTEQNHEDMRAEALRRYALGLDLPIEALLSTGSFDNCNSQLAVQRDAVRKVMEANE